jgi:peptide/nickel transport system substrate-binding protein
MSAFRRTVAALTLVAVCSTGVGACGGGSGSDGTSRTGPHRVAPGAARTGGTLTGYLTASPDYLDPALSFSSEGWNLNSAAYTPLLTYRHEEGEAGTEVIPGLARSLPEVSADGTTYRLRLRDGLRYSDGTPVKASDFEHAIKRVLNLESGGTSFFLPIVGAEQYVKRGAADGDIRGIVTNDQTGQIDIELTGPVGSFTNVLAMDFAALVPSSTPFRNMTTDPPPGVGPYVITSSIPHRSVRLERNPGFAVPDLPAGNVDEIDVKVVHNQQEQIQDVIQNKVDYVVDPPPAGALPEIRDKMPGRWSTYDTPSTFYIFLNTRIAPFDDEQVRRAVNYAVDKRALQRLFGGLLEPSCNFLPSGLKGYRKLDPCPYGDPRQAPDVGKAKQLIRDAGARGADVSVWGIDADASKAVTQYVASAMSDVGLNAKPKILEGSVYFATVGNQSTKAQAGFGNWYEDFPHPADFLFLLNGTSIQRTNNLNLSNVDDPQINALLDHADANPDLDAAAPQYAQADRIAIERAYVIPYGNGKLTKLVSDRVDFDTVVANPVYGVDLAQIAFK